MPSRTMRLALIAVAATVGVIIGRATRDAEAVAPAQRPAVDDTVSLSRLLVAVRGASPLYCELVARMADGRSYWSSGGGGSLIEVDSVASMLIRWVHAEHRDARIVPRLAAAVRDPDRCVSRVGASVLARVRHPSATAALLAALDEASPETRANAAVGLGLAETRGAMPALIRRLADPSPLVRRSSAWALGAIEDNGAMMPLIQLLERDTDPRVRQAAAWAIGEVTG